MFGSITLDVVIGLIFVYLLLSIICTTLNEWIAGLLKTRSSNLAIGIHQLLDNQPGEANPTRDWFTKQFYAHPLIQGMSRRRSGGKWEHPSYIPSRTFAMAVLDIIRSNQSGAISFAEVEAGIKTLPDGDVKRVLSALLQDAESDIALFRRNIEGWFDDTMDRVSGWYKRRTQVWTFVVALLLTSLSNADTLRITSKLWNTPTLRAQVVEQAKGRLQSSDAKDIQPTARVTQAETDTLDQLIGWKAGDWQMNREWWPRLFGWFLTIVAVSLGAPFWFDILNKFMNVRNAGRPPSESAKAPQKPKEPPQDKLA